MSCTCQACERAAWFYTHRAEAAQRGRKLTWDERITHLRHLLRDNKPEKGNP